jgi:uncharacterized membrane protein YdfJ with MMPL/SSD domain
MHLAERAGRWSAAHWKTATFGWLALVAAAVVIGGVVGTHALSPAEETSGDSARAEQILADAGFGTPAGESVVVRSDTATAASPALRTAVSGVLHRLARTPHVEHLHRAAVSADRHAVLVSFDVDGDPNTADQRVGPALDAVAAVQRDNPRLTVAEFGLASGNKAGNEVIGHDLRHAELLSVPATFLVLLLAFGAFAAAGLPVLLAFSAVLGTIGTGALVSHLVHASDTTSSVVLLMGMAVGVDYSLFYLKREREERSRGRGERESLLVAAATSGRAVLVSGLTVVVGCAGMLLSGSNEFVSIGVGAMLVVLVAMVGSLTVLPALLGKLGDRVDRGIVAVSAATAMRLLRREPRVLRRLRDRRTLLQRVKGGAGGESRVWGVLLRPALRRPRTAALAATALLVVLALPLLRIHTAQPGVHAFPQDLPIVKAYQAIDRSFPGSPGPAVVVLRAPSIDAPAVRHAVSQLKHRALASGVMHAPIVETVNPDRTVARIDVPLDGNGTDGASTHALGVLRQDVLPATLGTLPDAAYGVTGDAAQNADFGSALRTHTPLVLAVVLVVAFVVLLLAFGSLVVPLTAIALNLLSVGAAYGVLVWVFQDGHLHGLLGFQPTGAVVTWLPLFLFTVLFGLSMDYHVFIVSRIRELAARGMPTEEAVARGIRSTAATVTSAAAVMVAVFSIFALTRTLILKELGVGLAVAILLDATIVRAVLLPAVMTVLGERNWYLPGRLGWLPRLRLDDAPAPVLD